MINLFFKTLFILTVLISCFGLQASGNEINGYVYLGVVTTANQETSQDLTSSLEKAPKPIGKFFLSLNLKDT